MKQANVKLEGYESEQDNKELDKKLNDLIKKQAELDKRLKALLVVSGE